MINVGVTNMVQLLEGIPGEFLFKKQVLTCINIEKKIITNEIVWNVFKKLQVCASDNQRSKLMAMENSTGEFCVNDMAQSTQNESFKRRQKTYVHHGKHTRDLNVTDGPKPLAPCRLQGCYTLSVARKSSAAGGRKQGKDNHTERNFKAEKELRELTPS